MRRPKSLPPFTLGATEGVVNVMKKIIRIRGIIVPKTWNNEGGVTDIALSTAGENEYSIDDTTRGRELWKLLRADVEVEGVIREKGNKKTLGVLDYVVKRKWND